MAIEYFVLKSTPGDGGVRTGFKSRRFKTTSADGVETLDVSDHMADISSERLSKKEFTEALADPTLHLFPVMPVSLVSPVSKQDYGILGDKDPLSEALNLKASWGISAMLDGDGGGATGANVNVAVLDSGILRGHAAFSGIKSWICQDFTGQGGEDVTDEQGHGTHCAGTIFGQDVNGTRIGVSKGVQTAIVGKVIDSAGHGTASSLLNGLKWAKDKGANVISMSIGFDFPRMQENLVDDGVPAKLATSIALTAYRENLRLFEGVLSELSHESSYLSMTGLVVVAAAGNESMRQVNERLVIDCSFPAVCSPDIIAVGAVSYADDKYKVAPFSNANPTVCAPGVDIVSAGRDQPLSAMSGTSMACPHVSGVAALWWERLGSAATGRSVRAKILASASRARFPEDSKSSDIGLGLVSFR
ncbi:S8 family serine peptidase [Mesorhizobium sp. M0998]|uniref:S8 family serine peptidase n=1 Tax=Mesorhizobium sp. M0998 TaxID=2957044 RepID=UPI00333C4FE9